MFGNSLIVEFFYTNQFCYYSSMLRRAASVEEETQNSKQPLLEETRDLLQGKHLSRYRNCHYKDKIR